MRDNLWFKSPAPNTPARLRLFCFPYAGGATSIFRRWPEHLSPDIELCAVQLPGRENRINERPFTQLDPLINKLADVLLPFLDRPFAFYGHSMGTLIAFELARELRRRRRNGPAWLLVSGRCAPHIPDPEPPLHRLADAEFRQGLRRYNGTQEAVLNNNELMELLAPLLRADFALCETYDYKQAPPLDCPISAFAGTEEPCSGLLDDWRAQTTNAFDSQLFPGGHFFLNTERARFLSAISEKLTQIVEKNARRQTLDAASGAGACVGAESSGE